MHWCLHNYRLDSLQNDGVPASIRDWDYRTYGVDQSLYCITGEEVTKSVKRNPEMLYVNICHKYALKDCLSFLPWTERFWDCSHVADASRQVHLRRQPTCRNAASEVWIPLPVLPSDTKVPAYWNERLYGSTMDGWYKKMEELSLLRQPWGGGQYVGCLLSASHTM